MPEPQKYSRQFKNFKEFCEASKNKMRDGKKN